MPLGCLGAVLHVTVLVLVFTLPAPAGAQNSAPVVSGNTAIKYADQSTVAVHTYTANDPDGDTVTWSLSGPDSGDFNIGADTGILTFKSSPDYDNPADADTDNVYEVTVQASDGTEPGSLTGTLPVTVTINRPPVWAVATQDTQTTIENGTAKVNFAENGTGDIALFTLSDHEGDSTSVPISAKPGDKDGNRLDIITFTFNQNNLQGTIAVQFDTPPDYEDPDDSDTDNVYEITLRARDSSGVVGASYVELPVAVTVTNVHEPPTAEDDDVETDENTPVVINVLDNDFVDEAADSLTVTVEPPPANGTTDVTEGSTPTITYTPNDNFKGEDTFSYTVEDAAHPESPTTAMVTVGVANDNADLSSLSISRGSLSPTFDAETEKYIVWLGGDNSVKVTPSTAHDGATVRVNGVVVSSGSDSDSINLHDGGTTNIEVEVTSHDGQTVKTYTVTVFHPPNGPDVHIGELVGDSATPSWLERSVDNENICTNPAFSENGICLSDEIYTRFTAEATSDKVRIRLHAGDTGFYRTELVDIGQVTTQTKAETEDTAETRFVDMSRSIELDPDYSNNIWITVGGQHGLTSITTCYREANLSGLVVSAGTLAPTFHPGTTAYTASVANTVDSVTLTPELSSTASCSAQITVNDRAVASGSASEIITLNAVGTTPIEVKFTNGSSTRTYTVNVTRPVVVTKRNQTLTGFAYNPAELTFGDPPPTLTPPSGARTPVTYSATPDTVCTVEATTGALTITGVGTCTITATAAETDAYLAATATVAVEVLFQEPKVVGELPALTLYAGGAGQRVEAGEAIVGSELSWAFESSDTGVASVEPDGSAVVVAPVGEGAAQVTVTATNASGSASVAFDVTVQTSAAEVAAIRTALAGQARVVLGSVTDVIAVRMNGGARRGSSTRGDTRLAGNRGPPGSDDRDLGGRLNSRSLASPADGRVWNGNDHGANVRGGGLDEALSSLVWGRSFSLALGNQAADGAGRGRRAAVVPVGRRRHAAGERRDGQQRF